jgi:transcriptional regulator
MNDKLAVIPGTLELILLKSLAGEEPELHGFGILELVRERSDRRLEVEEAALYPALHRMERRGWLAATWGVSDKGRRAKYYRLTASGRAALAALEENWRAYVAALANVGPG